MQTQTLLMASLLLLSLAASSAWGEEEADAETISPDSQPETSNIEGWYGDEDEDAEGLADEWTFFGMGYESRTSATNRSATATAASMGGGGGKGKGGGKK